MFGREQAMTVGDFVLQAGQTVVLTGDSITDSGHRGADAPLGHGYVQLISSLSRAKRPERKINFINAGVSGDTVVALAQRWETDVLAHRPHWLSISIGVNDVWHQTKTPPGGVDIARFTATYRELLELTRARCGGCGLILMTPGIIGEDPDSETNRMLQPYVEAVEQLAGKFNAFCVPIHTALREAVAAGGGGFTVDGVHPNAAGYAVMALTWLQTLGW